jgi:hypothetical protein
MKMLHAAPGLALLCAAGAAKAALNPFYPLGSTPGPNVDLGLHPFYTCQVNYYVDGVNGNDANPGTQAKPWKTIQNADNGYPNVPVAGECVNVLPGTYPINRIMVFSHGGNANSTSGYVVYRSTVQGGAHIIAQAPFSSGNGDMIMLWAAYLVFDGFEIDGNSDVANGSGIDGCANGGSPGNIAHHFVVWNNTIHGMGGAGLSSCTADWISWQHNTVYNVSATDPWQTSALDLWEPALVSIPHPTSWDNNAYNIVIGRNLVHDNSEGPNLLNNNQGSNGHTDGNGIIIDTTKGKNYPGPILVLGNLAYRNGGGGVHVFMSQNVMVANNTCYDNYTDLLNPGTARGELSNGGSAGLVWVNNIAFATPTQTGVTSYNEPIVTFALPGYPTSDSGSNNIFWGAPVNAPDMSMANEFLANPLLSNPQNGRFRLKPGSPALAAGLPEPFEGGNPPDIGAEY